jgi:hypothetical protein
MLASCSNIQKVPAIFRGTGSASLSEHAGKVLLRLEATGYRNIQDTGLRRAQHVLRAFHPETKNKLVRALSS